MMSRHSKHKGTTKHIMQSYTFKILLVPHSVRILITVSSVTKTYYNTAHFVIAWKLLCMKQKLFQANFHLINKGKEKNIPILPGHRVMDAIVFTDYWKILKQQKKYELLAGIFKATYWLSQSLSLTIYSLRISWLIQQFSSCN